MRFFRVAVAVNLTQRIAFWGTISYFAAYLIHTHGLSIGFVALPLAIAAMGQMVGSYSAASVANSRYCAAFVAATTAAGGVRVSCSSPSTLDFGRRLPWQRLQRAC
jgi:hypothetical protein